MNGVVADFATKERGRRPRSERSAERATGRPLEPRRRSRRATQHLTEVGWKLLANGKITTVLLYRGEREAANGLEM